MNKSVELAVQASGVLVGDKKPEPVTFPWPEIRDFISVHISELLAQQNLMVGEQMLNLKAPGTTEEMVEKVRATHAHLKLTSQNLNMIIEHRLAQLDGKPRILVPR